jgi:hypothetical protein
MANGKLETEQKALEINLNNGIYGTFAEIGAGQEVARYFFQAGGSSGTIAKTMSAYDKTYSDAIYGVEESGRYVCENRIYKMLDHEYVLMEDRLRSERKQTNFFAFANTIAAINYQKTIKGNGWMGLRFQLDPLLPPNDFVLHVRMLDNDNHLQQDAIGILGVNMIFASFYHKDNISAFLQSLMDDLKGRIFIDMIRLEGPHFRSVDHRLLCLEMVRLGLTDVAMFGPDGRSVQATEFLYKKSVLIVRSRFRPVTIINWEMFHSGAKQFAENLDIPDDNVFVLPEITLEDLQSEGAIDTNDYLERITLLNEMGHVVVISNCNQHQKLINYLLDYKIKDIGFVMSIWHLKDIIHEKYDNHKESRLLASFGAMFSRQVKIYAYPAIDEKSGQLITTKNMEIPSALYFLYQFLLTNGYIMDIESFSPQILQYYSKEVLRSLRKNEPGWQELVPPGMADVIQLKKLFGFGS